MGWVTVVCCGTAGMGGHGHGPPGTGVTGRGTPATGLTITHGTPGMGGHGMGGHSCGPPGTGVTIHTAGWPTMIQYLQKVYPLEISAIDT